MNYSKTIQLVLGPLLAIILNLWFDLVPGNPLVTKMAGVGIWMAVWWLTEIVPLAVTALLPIILMPILGILDSKNTAIQYMDPIIFLFIGGFIVAFAIERWSLHKRIALKILSFVGTSPSRILFGVMITSYLLSMWISNTAAVMMLISAVMAIVVQIEKHFYQEEDSKKLATALLIGLAYSGTIGGMATLVGTPTNMIFLREYTSHYPANNDLSFLSWFKIGFPISLFLFAGAFFTLKKFFISKELVLNIDQTYFSDQYKSLGKMSFEEKVVSVVFFVMALLWFTRSDIDLGFIAIKGWNNLFENKNYVHDSTVAIIMAVLLFLIPSKNEKGTSIITWKEVQKLPFDIILLFGGGFAMAKGFSVSGLSNWLGSQLSFTEETNIYVVIFSLCVLVTVISEFASNVACIQLMLPILIVLQNTLHLHPLMLMLPATLASSLGFMLPVATAPNTIVFGSHRLKVKDMLKSGLSLDIIGILIITIATFFIQKLF